MNNVTYYIFKKGFVVLFTYSVTCYPVQQKGCADMCMASLWLFSSREMIMD